MNRTNLAVIVLLVIMFIGVVLQSSHVKEGGEFYELKVEEIRIEGLRPRVKMTNASQRLVRHCRIVVAQSLGVAKLTVNIVFDVAIEIID